MLVFIQLLFFYYSKLVFGKNMNKTALYHSKTRNSNEASNTTAPFLTLNFIVLSKVLRNENLNVQFSFYCFLLYCHNSIVVTQYINFSQLANFCAIIFKRQKNYSKKNKTKPKVIPNCHFLYLVHKLKILL